MANTYTQIYLHLVFAVKFRKNQIRKEWKEELYKYICGIVNNKNEKIYAINGVSDHIHILLSIKPDFPISKMVGSIKANSSKWINGKHYTNNEFKWQEGFGAFSISPGHVSSVINYIDRQETHHQKKSFREEYHAILDEYKIQYDERYLFEWLD